MSIFQTEKLKLYDHQGANYTIRSKSTQSLNVVNQALVFNLPYEIDHIFNWQVTPIFIPN